MIKEPLAIVTHVDDREFSDIVNWVLQALFFGEEKGLGKYPPLCQKDTMLPSNASDLDCMNAVCCVGNYGDIYGGDDAETRGIMNLINNSTGLLYVLPFDNLDDDEHFEPSADSAMANVANEGILNCGVIVSEDFDGDIEESDKLVGACWYGC